MTKRLLLTLLTLITISTVQAQLFRQNFCTSENVSSYDDSSPNSGEFNLRGGSNGSVHFDIDNSKLLI
ncbi:MAG: hypothetical protein NWR73_00900, partial [Flavobacteriales bacterium]|nr:hypothetical protein [Flavobacteriales bacterium]